MSRAENEAYWGSTDTAPSALDNFFDEDSNVSWTGYAGGYLSQSSKTAPCNGSGNAVSHGGQPVPSCTSITDNITIHSVTDRAVVDIPGTGNNSEKLSKGVGKAIGEKLDSWKPPSVSIKWNSSQGQGNGYCVQCSAKDNEISQLKKRLEEMQERPHATQLYVTYLKKRHNYAEAIDFLRLLGKPDDAAILAYEFALTSRAPEVKVKNMRKTLDNSFTDPNLSYEAKIVKENIKLLERQMAIDETDHNDLTNPMLTKYPRAANIVDKSLLTTLYYCCMYHWDSVESHAGSPMALRKAHSFTDHQVLWTILRGRARVNHWPLPNELDSWLGSKGLLGALGSITSAFSGAGKAISTLKSTLPIEQVVHTLSASGAPANVLAVYLALIDSIDTRLKLAMNYKCHQGVIDAYISQKDRDALEKYMHEIPAGSPEYLKAENALKSAKWKN
ncbi:Spermatogenesis-defective protein 39-like [Homarus americanus]|uniref:Spermatogenesis-defective protein 39-like n=1 Tax=Homarus americanus TaxID=6706 RepID=A0A8J5NB59_HOMAM|nr:Spermatogenesis-defective protein 39-like [Homarus americanus]